MLLLAELRRHAALALDALLERDAGQVAFEVVAPAVVDAGDLLAVALPGQAQQVAAMGAAVDEGIDRAVRPARDDDRDLADRRRHPIAGVRDLGGQAQIAPGRPLEDALLFERVLLGVGVEAEGDFADAVRRPADRARNLQAHLGHRALLPRDHERRSDARLCADGRAQSISGTAGFRRHAGRKPALLTRQISGGSRGCAAAAARRSGRRGASGRCGGRRSRPPGADRSSCRSARPTPIAFCSVLGSTVLIGSVFDVLA